MCWCNVIVLYNSPLFSFLSMDKDSQDVHQELAKLKAKIQEAREQISNMPGIDSSPVEQQQQLATLREQVRTKNQLLQKYKSLCMFDVPKASWDRRLDYCSTDLRYILTHGTDKGEGQEDEEVSMNMDWYSSSQWTTSFLGLFFTFGECNVAFVLHVIFGISFFLSGNTPAL